MQLETHFFNLIKNLYRFAGITYNITHTPKCIVNNKKMHTLSQHPFNEKKTKLPSKDG